MCGRFFRVVSFWFFFLLHVITKNLPPFLGVSWWSKGWEACGIWGRSGGAAGVSFVLRGKTTLVFPFDSLLQSNESSRGGEGRGACGHVRGVLKGEEEGSVVWGVCWRSIWSTVSPKKPSILLFPCGCLRGVPRESSVGLRSKPEGPCFLVYYYYYYFVINHTTIVPLP